MLYPLTFHPIYKERIWGGRNLERLYQKQLPAGKTIGESWEISDRPGDVSVIANGPLSGKDLRWLMEHHAGDLLGDARTLDNRFPLLLKILDAQETLSLQVHPPESVAHRLGGEPKTELWYISDSDPKAELFVGLRKGVTKSEFTNRVQNGTVAECFHRVRVRAGDAMFLPSGRVHAVGAGNVIFEIQQNSDTTYRVFDWNRVEANGRPRELHVAQSLDSIEFEDFEPGLVSSSFSGGNHQWRQLVADPLFEVREHRIEPGLSMETAKQRASIFAIVSGTIQVDHGNGALELRPGNFVLVPASVAPVTLRAVTACRFLEALPG